MRRILLILLLLIPVVAFPQRVVVNSLEQALVLARQHNHELKQAQLRVQVSRQDASRPESKKREPTSSILRILIQKKNLGNPKISVIQVQTNSLKNGRRSIKSPKPKEIFHSTC